MTSELFEAIRKNDIAQATELLENVVNLANMCDHRGFSPLIMATYAGSPEMVSLLLEYHADVNAQDAAGNTALMGVAFKGKLEMANLLLAHGADLRITNKSGETAADFAEKYNQPEMAAFLKHHQAL